MDQVGRYCQIENISFIQIILAALPLGAGLVLSLVVRKLDRFRGRKFFEVFFPENVDHE